MILGKTERNAVHTLKDVRNKWAHLELKGFSTDEIYRAIDIAGLLLSAVAAPQAGEVEGRENRTHLNGMKKAHSCGRLNKHYASKMRVWRWIFGNRGMTRIVSGDRCRRMPTSCMRSSGFTAPNVLLAFTRPL